MDQVPFHCILMRRSGSPARLSWHAYACSSPSTKYQLFKLSYHQEESTHVNYVHIRLNLNPSVVGRAEVYIIQLTTATQLWLSKLFTITAPPIAKSSFADEQSNKAQNETEKTLRQGYTDAYVSSATKCSPPSILSLSVPMILCQIMQVARSLQSY